MNRRSFFTSMVPLREDRNPLQSGFLRPAASGLEPYVPSSTQPWDAIRAGHLLRRTTLLPRWADIVTIMAMTPSDAVDLLLNGTSTPTPPSCADDATESLEGLDVVYQGIIRAQWQTDYGTLANWYADVLRQAPLALSEKMALFWSGHFTSQFTFDMEYAQAPLLYRQNQLYRDTGLANFKDLVMNVTLDGAMLTYLGGILNTVGAPNENYARELMELFTMGLGNYTEGDVKEAARILTGWRVARFSDQPALNGIFKPYFLPEAHDIGAKEYLGVSFAARDANSNTEFLVRRDEVRKLVDTIFDKRGSAVAKYICRKIYRFFVYSSPTGSDEAVISAMADVFTQNNFDIKPVMSALLKSQHFFDNLNIGSQIKTPAEFMVGIARQLGASQNIAGNMASMDEQLFQPPNVSGWPGYREWITTTTYPVRANVAGQVITAMSDNDLVNFIKQFPDYTDVTKLTDHIASLLLPRPMSQARHDSLEAKLLAGQPGYEWPTIIGTSPSTAARNLREMLTTITELPDFQLC